MVDENHLLTTFIPNRNHGKFLKQSVDSVMAQSHPPFELILLDDASLDDSVDQMEQMERDLKGKTDVKVRSRAKHSGHIATYNKGILSATGKYVHLMAADDKLIDPDFYKKALEILEANPDVSFVFGGLIIKDEYGEQNGKTVLPPIAGMHGARDWLSKMVEYGNFVCGGACIVRTELQRSIGGYDHKFPYSADWVNWIRLLGTGTKAYAIEGTVYQYRRHRAQMTHQRSAPAEERARAFEVLSHALRNLP